MKVIECDLTMEVMGLNEEMEKMCYYVGSSKAVRMKATRPSEFQSGSSERIECIQ